MCPSRVPSAHILAPSRLPRYRGCYPCFLRRPNYPGDRLLPHSPAIMLAVLPVRPYLRLHVPSQVFCHPSAPSSPLPLHVLSSRFLGSTFKLTRQPSKLGYQTVARFRGPDYWDIMPLRTIGPQKSLRDDPYAPSIASVTQDRCITTISPLCLPSSPLP